MGLVYGLKKEIMVIFFSMLPIIEVRGSIPLGISMGLGPIHSTILSLIGGLIISTLLLQLLNPCMLFFERTKLFKNAIGWIKRRSMKKAATIKKYSLIGLFFFVAIPFPTTGIWTASLIATILKLDRKRAFIYMNLGLVTSSTIVLAIYYGVFG